MRDRKPYVRIWQELSRDKGMIFLSGPRQAGKTTLAQIISQSFANYLYFNWDIPQHRIRLIKDPAFFETVERVERKAIHSHSPSVPMAFSVAVK
ncbi:MAG: AAA family ATPase [Candidatus Scalindua sp.]|nr:AAA family ATPase [Candidatus Scalindua sp.]